jgi:hypothetical protein
MRTLRALRSFGLAAAMILPAAASSAHDLERTQVTIVFAPDGSFVADIANDRSWLALRLASVPGNFADRVVLWVDGHEIRPSSVEFIPPSARPEPFDSSLTLSPSKGERLAQGRVSEALATYRLRGRMPIDAHTLRWYYGLVIDPYPLTIRRADGRMLVEEVGGDAWSRTIDLSGQFHAPLLNERMVGALIAALFTVPLAIQMATKLTKKRTRKSRKEEVLF